MMQQVTDIPGMARAIYRRMPNVKRFLDVDDIEQECELQRLRGEARSFHQLHYHVIDIARHFGGRDGCYATDELPPSNRLPVLTAPSVERGIMLRQLMRALTGQQACVIDTYLDGWTPAEAGLLLGIRPKTVTHYKHAAVRRMRAVATRISVSREKWYD